MDVYIGLDVGSVSTNIVVLDSACTVLDSLYVRTQGRPVETVQRGLKRIRERFAECTVKGFGTTGSGRQLAGIMVGADVIKNEITAHAVAAMHLVPEVQTVIEIGGQDSKLILIRNGVVSDFAMNTVCAAGTGSFLDQQSARLNLPIEEFGAQAVTSLTPVAIAGRCAVFAESDMIHKQQEGHQIPDILNGLCHSLVRNYLNNVGKGRQLKPPFLFQGGVAANQGMVRAFETALRAKVIVPEYFAVMGALGAALLAKEETEKSGKSQFKGFDLVENFYTPRSFVCNGCPNLCEVVEMQVNNRPLARWGGICGKWDMAVP